MKIKIILLVVASIFFGGCSLFQTDSENDIQVEFMPGVTITLPEPHELNMDEKLSQIVSATYHADGKESHFSTQIEVIVDSKHIVMIALAGWGGSLFKLDYNGKHIQSSSLPMPNQNIGVKQSLTEFIICNAPLIVVQEMFAHTGLHIQENDNERLVLDKDDNKVMSVIYSKDGDKLIHNYHYNYIVKVHDL
jgi:hypothetical protein